ncbi:MAG: restriction endonuclease subunit S, partial [Muribaculaceae bacterium]|nr:restriction endonuclease subunit S [Muribaculaceae bacterium]
SYIKDFLQDLGNGPTFKEISKTKTENVIIPVPPIDIQKHIATELDKLNELIEIKHNQLKDLDALAESLFYESFGDPIENPKGWETKLFGEIIRLKSGEALSAKNFCNGQYPVYGGNGIAGYHNKYNISGHNIIIGRVGALCGNVRLIDADIFVTDNAFIVNLQQDMNLRFLERLLTLLELRKYANAAAQPVISNTSLKVINVPIPPISLQNDFAAKVEAIEAQKRLIESSIADLETLLASRMDYWFND